ncbi:hypothetical protein ACTXT7_008973 [Hymenolepis weldensis]
MAKALAAVICRRQQSTALNLLICFSSCESYRFCPIAGLIAISVLRRVHIDLLGLEIDIDFCEI